MARSVPTRLASALDPASCTVSVILPIRNEVLRIAETLQAVLEQSFPPERTEIIVVDGLSDDGTYETVRNISLTHPRIRLLKNPKKIAACGLNQGIEASRGEVIVRIDGHCLPARDYLEQCVRLLAKSRAGNVGGLMRPRGTGIIAAATSIALMSRFGIGDSRFHYLEEESWAETVYLGAFRREVLQEVNLYNPRLPANEDFELNFRIRQAGYGILLSPDIVSIYEPRTSLGALWSQYQTYGRWKARVMVMHPFSTRLRHFVPPIFVLSVAAGVVSFVRHRKPWVLSPVASYLVLLTVVSCRLGLRRRQVLPALPAVFITMHVGWGIGLLKGLISDVIGLRAVTHLPFTAHSESGTQ